MIPLDMRTVVAAHVVANIVCLGVMAWLWQGHRRRFDGLGLWLGYASLETLSVALITLRGTVPTPVSLLLGVPLSVAALIALVHGLGRFTGLARSVWPDYVLLGAATLAHAYYAFADPSVAGRIVIFNAAVAAVALQGGWLMLRRWAAVRAGTGFVGLLLLALAAIASARIWVSIHNPPGPDFFAAPSWDAAAVLASLGLSVAVIFALVRMVNRRLVASLERDVAARRAREGELTLAMEVLAILNRDNEVTKAVDSILELIRHQLQIDAVAIRLRAGDDYPYFEYVGLPEWFVWEEHSLLLPDPGGASGTSVDARPRLDCLCGAVLSGDTDASKPCYTTGGSFWTNRLGDLSVSAASCLHSRALRRTCNRAGYESVALIPLRTDQGILGLLQLNDRAPGRFSLEHIQFLERLSASIGIALARRQAVGRLQQSEARARLLFDASPDGLFVLGPEGRHEEVNAVAIARTGYTRDELLGMTALDLVAPAAREAVSLHLRSAADGERRFESLRLTKEGREYPVELTVRPLVLDDRPCLLVLEHDLTARKQAEDDARRLQGQFLQAQKLESVGRLAGGVAHDYNNMLSVILGRVDLAMAQVAEHDPVREDLEEIQRAAARSADVTRQLLAFARRQVAVPRVLSLNDTVESTLKMLRRLIGEDIDLVWRPAENLWPIEIDPTQIDQILANLCVNARDAIADVGRVTIETANVVVRDEDCALRPDLAPGPHVRLSVSDTGVGMDRDTLARIFEPFFTTKGAGLGTGLGLPTVYGIVKQNGGFINVDSDPGIGSTFSIHLPRATGSVVAQDGPAATPVPAGSGETVLVVEDEGSILKLTADMLGRLGYVALTAEAPEQAMAVAAEHSGAIHLVITDVVMPGMNGQELARRLRAMRSDLACLFMSGYSADVVSRQGVLDSGTHFLSKPFTMSDLAKAVRDAITHQPLNQTSSRGHI